jgi:NAD-dependent deacetylase
LVYDIDGWELKKGDKCERGSQLRPHVVWFGEPVPMIEPAAEISSEADIYLVVGTSLNVYPAAGLIHYTRQGIPMYLIDPLADAVAGIQNLTVIHEQAGKALPDLAKKLMANES